MDLVHLLRSRASEQPERAAYTFLRDGEEVDRELTLSALDRQARAIAAALQAQVGAGERAILLYPAGLDFVSAFFGCLFAGVVAVPSYPPSGRRPQPRLRAIARDARPRVVLTTAGFLAAQEEICLHVPELLAATWIATDALDDDLAASWREVAPGPDALAFLQYTSGSTADPKGVQVSHGNLLHNEEQIRRAFAQSEQSVIVGWLPLFHDMGLIGNVLQPLWVGARCILMSPLAFLQQPARWLRAISDFRATTSGGPNFAYELCARKVTPEARAGLDLSSWSLAFNGAEPVRAETLERFATTFASCGFRREAFYPCYGLAEATLFVSGGQAGEGATLREVDAKALESHRAEAPAEESPARTLIGCGTAWAEQTIAIVDPETAVELPPGRVGEIWVRGPSVAHGYWQRAEESARVFGAHLAAGDGPYLRTGDLGFLAPIGGELYVTGRSKDLLILRGRNHYPQDLEHTAETAHPALRAGGSAAFSVEIEGEERVVLVAEVERKATASVTEIAAAVRRSVAETHEIGVAEIVLIPTGTLPKTSSGKVQRQACRAAYLEDRLSVVDRSRSGESEEAGGEGVPVALDRARLRGLDAGDRASEVEAWLRGVIARACRIAPATVEPGRPLAELGLDSLAGVEIQQAVDGACGVSLSLADLLAGATLASLAETVLASLAADETAPAPSTAGAGESDTAPLSVGQRALWFLDRLAPESAAYNLAAAARVRGPLDVAALRAALADLLARHPMLRSRFEVVDDQARQRVLPAAGPGQTDEPDFTVEDARGWSAGQVRERLAVAARQPFDLEDGGPLRLLLLAHAPDEHSLLLVIHHLVSDFWSLVVLLADLETLYRARAAGQEPALPAPAATYAEHVRQEAELLAGPRGAALEAYWLERLGMGAGGALPVLELPADRPRPAVQSFRGGALPVALDAETGAALARLVQPAGATPFMGLLALFMAFLHRASGQRQILVGSPTSGRGRAEAAGVVGYFVNPVVLRADFDGSPSFRALLAALRETVLGAFAHQEAPFARVAERLQPQRDASRSPVFQAMLVLQKAQRPPSGRSGPGLSGLERLAGFALGEAGPTLDWAGLELASIPLAWRPALFDLTLTLAADGAGFAGSLQYAADLFDAATVARWRGHLAVLARAIAAAPDRALAELPLLAAGERAQLLGEWNDTARPVPGEALIHRAFAAQAARTPAAPALTCHGESLDYAELDRRSNRLAHHLRALGIAPESRVGVCLERSLDMVVALLAILKSGGAYVPLDPAYPRERLDLILADAGVAVLITEERLARKLRAVRVPLVRLDAERATLAARSAAPLEGPGEAAGLAYLIYTSGSTGKPKGVMVTHGNVANFFAGMDACLGSTAMVRTDGGTEPGCWLAVTSISFDISVLELLWTLTRGFHVVLHAGEAGRPALSPLPAGRPIDLSLFYFASAENEVGGAKYRLLLEGAKLGDRHGFAAVWTPERHFHSFGGLYPNPAVTGAAIAAITQRIGIRAGSVVLPLHHPARIAEEWSVVDNLSGGRVGISLASGWNAADFVLAPERYAARKEILQREIDVVRRLWRGEAVRFPGGMGEVEIRTLPRPVQPELPVWVTAAGSPDTFRMAGEMGLNLLTHLLGQSSRDLGEKIAVYRDAWRQAGHAGEGKVALMLHTFVGEDAETVRETVRGPFTRYLESSLDLMRVLAPGQDLSGFTEEDRQALLARAFDRYFETSGLFGTPESCLRRVGELRELGVDDIACLIDFGVPTDVVLDSLELLAEVLAATRPTTSAAEVAAPETLPALIARHAVTHLQMTPSGATALLADPAAPEALAALRVMMVGGEALPAATAERLTQHLGGPLLDMYGPTETTIWSAVGRVEAGAAPRLGRPIANTELRLVDARLQPVPAGQPGELLIGGDGVVRGYLERPRLTAERFVPDPWRPGGARLYRTGDLARWGTDGRPVFMGRLDHQVKLRGHRIELGEVESVLARHPAVAGAVVTVREDVPGDQRLVAYLVPAVAAPPDLASRLTPVTTERVLTGYNRHQLPNGMLVAHLSAEQTSAIYREIYEDEIYLRHGIELAEGACVFDVGANIGLFTLFAAGRGRDLRLFSFEPIPPTFAVLAANVELYGLPAQVFPFGISDREEEADFTFYPQMAGLSGRFAGDDEEVTRSIVETWMRRSATEPSANGNGRPEGVELDDVVHEMLRSETHRCRLRPLSALIHELGIETIDLLKVDVEKSELKVLDGIAPEDWPRIRQIVLEVHSRELLDETTTRLAVRGFRFEVDEFIPVGELGEAVWMVYGHQTAPGTARPLAAGAPALVVSELRSYLRERLPQPMLPAAYVVMPAFPLTPNGKIDRKALPAPDGRRVSTKRTFVAPQDEIQERIAGVWKELLRVDEIGIHDNFFEAGGNSLLLVEAHGRLRRALGREVTLVELMRHPTVSALAQFLSLSGPGEAGEGEEARQKKVDERASRQRQAFARRDRRPPGQRESAR